MENFVGSVVHWAQVTSNGTVNPIRPIDFGQRRWLNQNAGKLDLTDKSRPLYMAIAAAEGCVNIESSPDPKFWTKSSFRDLEAGFVDRWPLYGDFRVESSVKGACQSLDLPKGVALNTTMIVARLQVASFALAQHPEHTMDRQCETDLGINDESGRCIGMVVTSPQLSAWKSPQTGSQFEFVGLSLGVWPWPAHTFWCLDLPINYPDASFSKLRKDLESIEFGDVTYWDSEGNPLTPIPIMNVMLIERRGRVARRISIGWILLTMWACANRALEIIILE
jgi:hypothetical protein